MVTSKFPKLARITANPGQLLLLPEGWRDLLEKMAEEVSRVDAQVRFSQVKEKFGNLRAYTIRSAIQTEIVEVDEIQEIILKYERAATKICGHCGNDAHPIKAAWQVEFQKVWPHAVCDKCATVREVMET